MDISISAVALVLLAPLFGLLALAVVADSGRPIFFSQRRVGLGFRKFRIWKFRSMRLDPSGPALTVGGDSRVTRVGKWLRAAKLDELPQLWNVLRGDMSLVGPRPEVPEYVRLYPERYRLVLGVRPGVTDLASIEFRDEEALLALSSDPEQYYVKRVLPAKLDLAEKYLRERTLSSDMRILLRTVGAVFRTSC